jgi:hypothetical protein
MKAWVVTADMGYGHQRAVHPLKDIAEGNILTVGSNPQASKKEKKLWKRVLGTYEFLSRAKSIPIVGNPIFNLFDFIMRIPSSYPIRDLSNSTFQVDFLKSSIKKGLCNDMLGTISQKNLPVITSFYASAIAADMFSSNDVYCIICDADINRAWVAKEPWESKIVYFAPCGKAAQRLKAYGVPDERIIISGFPLPLGLTGDSSLSILKDNLKKRLIKLDPNSTFMQRHGVNVKYYLGDNFESIKDTSKLTITFAVGGAGAQKEIGGKIAMSLKNKILNNQVKLILIAGTKHLVRDYFLSIKEKITRDKSKIEIVYEETLESYFTKFNEKIAETDILWTKPSELSFYSALGIPIIMAQPIGSQEKFNAKWLFEIQAGIKQENPAFTDQWLFEMLKKGRFAEAAWSGFLKARKLGTHKIIEYLSTGKTNPETSFVLR